MLFVYDEELVPLNMRNEKEEVKPCDKKAFSWCLRMCTMFFITTLLLSISLVAWHQYNIDLTVDDAEQPKILAMGNTCYNRTWNCNLIENDNNALTYKVSFFEDAIYDLLYLNTLCEGNVDFPYIYLNNASQCCNFVLYNTI